MVLMTVIGTLKIDVSISLLAGDEGCGLSTCIIYIIGRDKTMKQKVKTEAEKNCFWAEIKESNKEAYLKADLIKRALIDVRRIKATIADKEMI